VIVVEHSYNHENGPRTSSTTSGHVWASANFPERCTVTRPQHAQPVTSAWIGAIRARSTSGRPRTQALMTRHPALIRGDAFACRIKREVPHTVSGFEAGVLAHGSHAERVGELLSLIRAWAGSYYQHNAARISCHPNAADTKGLTGCHSQATRRTRYLLDGLRHRVLTFLELEPAERLLSRPREPGTMTTLTSHRKHTAPVGLLSNLRSAPTTRADTLAAALEQHGLQQLDGGRNNDVFAWTSVTPPVCIKLYKKTDRQRVEREWHGLTHAAGLGCAPEPLWLDQGAEQPAIGMTLLPGRPILDVLDPASMINAMAATTRDLQAIPLNEPLASLERVDSIGHYTARLADVWPGQLAQASNEAADDAHTRDMFAVLHRWQTSGDAEQLAQPAARVYSRGDANLLNWLHDGHNTYVADFEFSGYSDVAVDAADQVEHISARAIPDEIWTNAEAELGVTPRNRPRFDAAQRTIALRWLAVLWKQRITRVDEFNAQYERVRALQG
jgi:hypothetical protein